MFVWLAQSCYSFLQGASHPHELFAALEKSGFAGLCLCDFDGVYGLVKAWTAAKAYPRHKLAYGAQVTLSLSLPTLPGILEHKGILPPFLQNRIAYVALNAFSYGEICTLLTRAHRTGKVSEPLPLLRDIPWPQHAAAILPMRGSTQLFSPREKELHASWLREVEIVRSLHGDRFFLAITPPSNSLERNAFENHLAAHASLGIPLLATDDVFFHEPERKALHDVLTAIRYNARLDEIPWARFANAERHIHSQSVLERFFSRTPTLRRALENNEQLESLLNFRLEELRYQYPNEFIPKGHTASSYLRWLTTLEKERRYPNGAPEKLSALLEKEFALVQELGFADYFLTVWDIVRFARSQDILCQGRGSAANSAICFLLGITAVDPMVSDVLFERFISRERGEPPDIDVDFEHERREEVIQYIYERYGRDRAAMVANVITFKTRGALRAVAKALGIKDEVTTVYQGSLRDGVGYQTSLPTILSEGRSRLPLSERTRYSDDVLTTWARLAMTLRGFPRHLGIHSGGFVVSQEALTKLSGIEPATMPGRSVVQWNKDDLEALGFFKIDVLALGMLTALRKTLAILHSRGKRVPGTLLPIALDTIPPNCPATYRMICEARTTGVFQIESRAQMSILPRIKPKDFYDIVVSIGIVRPGPIVSGMVHSYVQRRLGLEPVTIPDKRLLPILHRTLGVPVFQEQVMRVAMAVADFSPGEADELRRAMGAWKFTGDMQRFESKLREGMQRNGIPTEFAEVIYKQISGFSQYGFPESHATSFAHLAYASAWLKAHFPAEFLCGLLNSQPLGFYSIHSLLQEARHAGVRMYAPCLYASQWDSFVTIKGAVQLGFRLLSKLQQEHVEEFIKRRKENGLEDPFALLDCFHSHEQIALVMSGCFRRYERNRRDLLWRVLANPSRLLDDVPSTRFEVEAPLFEAWDNMHDDYSHLDTTLANHPVALIKQLGWPFAVPIEKLTAASQIARVPSSQTVTVAGLQMIRQCPPTAKGMVFITLEDETGTANLVIRPDVYLRFRERILCNDLLCVVGKKQSNGTQATIRVTQVMPLTDAQSYSTPPPTPHNSSKDHDKIVEDTTKS